MKRTYSGLMCVWLLSAMAVSAFAAPDTGTGTDADVDTTTDAAPTDVRKERPWAFTGYTVWLSEEQLGDMLLFQATLSDSQLWVAALSRKIASPTRSLDFEVEGQVGKHAGPVQRHWEFNALGTLRWTRFPWNNFIDTTAGIGLGLSYATSVPSFEIEAHGTSNRTLVYIMIELTASLPKLPQWALVGRIHHRSSGYGLFEDNIQGASNAAGLGIKYRF